MRDHFYMIKFFSMNWFRVHYWTWKVKVQLSAHFRAVWVIQHWSDVRVAINQLSHWASSLPFTYTQLCMGETSAINQISPLWLGRKWLIMHYLIYCFWDSFDLEVKHTINSIYGGTDTEPDEVTVINERDPNKRRQNSWIATISEEHHKTLDEPSYPELYLVFIAARVNLD